MWLKRHRRYSVTSNRRRRNKVNSTSLPVSSTRAAHKTERQHSKSPKRQLVLLSVVTFPKFSGYASRAKCDWFWCPSPFPVLARFPASSSKTSPLAKGAEWKLPPIEADGNADAQSACRRARENGNCFTDEWNKLCRKTTRKVGKHQRRVGLCLCVLEGAWFEKGRLELKGTLSKWMGDREWDTNQRRAGINFIRGFGWESSAQECWTPAPSKNNPDSPGHPDRFVQSSVGIDLRPFRPASLSIRSVRCSAPITRMSVTKSAFLPLQVFNPIESETVLEMFYICSPPVLAAVLLGWLDFCIFFAISCRIKRNRRLQWDNAG